MRTLNFFISLIADPIAYLSFISDAFLNTLLDLQTLGRRSTSKRLYITQALNI